MTLIGCIGNLGSLHVFVILLSQDVNFRAIIPVDELALIFVFLQYDIICEKNYYSSLALFKFFCSIFIFETHFDSVIDKIEPIILCRKYLNVHLIDIFNLIADLLALIHLLLSLVHDQDLIF